MYKIIAIYDDLKETVISTGELDDMIHELNDQAMLWNYLFVKDSSLFGGYYVNQMTGTCYLIK